MKIGVRLKILILLIFLSITFTFIIQSITKQYIEKLVTDKLLENVTYLDEIIRETEKTIRFENLLIIAETMIKLKKNEDILEAIVIDQEKNIFTSNMTNQKEFAIGSLYDLNLNDYVKKENYYFREMHNKFALVKKFRVKEKFFYAIITLSMNKINLATAELNSYYIIIGSIIILCSILISAPLSNFLTKKIINITQATEIIGNGNWDYKIEIKSKFEDELDVLSEKINDMGLKIKESIIKLIDHERIKTEIEIGQKIQSRMLTPTDKNTDNIEISGFYKPAKEIGGDYYDFIHISDNKTFITIADSVGKGIGAGILATMYMTVINSEISHNIEPVNILKKANKKIGRAHV